MFNFPLNNPYQQIGQPLTVNGIESAKAYSMGPNSRIFLFDTNEDIFYVKETDASGFAKLKIFRFEEVKEEEKPADPRYLTIEEFNKFKEELLNGKQFIRSQSENARSSNRQYTANKGRDGNAEE